MAEKLISKVYQEKNPRRSEKGLYVRSDQGDFASKKKE